MKTFSLYIATALLFVSASLAHAAPPTSVQDMTSKNNLTVNSDGSINVVTTPGSNIGGPTIVDMSQSTGAYVSTSSLTNSNFSLPRNVPLSASSNTRGKSWSVMVLGGGASFNIAGSTFSFPVNTAFSVNFTPASVLNPILILTSLDSGTSVYAFIDGTTR